MIEVGYGFFLETSLDEALPIIKARKQLLTAKIEKTRRKMFEALAVSEFVYQFNSLSYSLDLVQRSDCWNCESE